MVFLYLLLLLALAHLYHHFSNFKKIQYHMLNMCAHTKVVMLQHKHIPILISHS